MRTRYIADWIIDMDDDGTDKEARSVHATYEEAERAAFKGARDAGCIQWARVREQTLTPMDDGGPPAWLTTRRWTGDWDVLEEVL